MAKETRKVHISVTSNASKDLNKGTVAAKGLSGSLKGVATSANLATGGIKAMTMALLSSGVGALVVGVGALVAGIGGLISKSAQYEKALSGLKAVTGATTEDIAKMSQQAKDLGSSTAFTASQVVSLQTELAKLGFKTDDIQNSTASILDLAAALEIDLGEAAEFAGSLVRSFGLTTIDTQRIVDVMALSTSSSALNFESLRESLKLVAPVAKAVNVPVEKTTALLAVLADRGLKGSIAGTGLAKTFIMLSKKGMTLEQGLDKLKSSGGDLNTAIDMVGVVAAKTFLTLASGQGDIAGLEESFNNASGAAKTLADERLNNLSGKITILKSAWEGFILGLEDGTGGLNRIAKGAIVFLTNAIGFLKEQIEKTVVSWDLTMMSIQWSGKKINQAWERFKLFGAQLASFGVDAKEALADVPFFGGMIDKEALAEERKAIDKRLADGRAAVEKFAKDAVDIDKKQQDMIEAYYKGAAERKAAVEVAALEKLNEELIVKKEKKLTEEEQKELDAKKEFLAKLKKLEQDTDDTTALEKIQRKRERHLEELKQVVKDKTELKQAEATINAIYDAQRDAQIDLNNEKRKKIFDDFTKQFALQDGTAEENIEAKREAHLAELEQLKLDETEKEEAKLAIKNFYDGQIDAVNAAKRVTKQEQDLADLEMKKQLISQGLDLAIDASGQESKIGQALLKIKQAMMLAELGMKMSAYIQTMKMQAQEGLQSTAIKGAEQSASINVGFANAAKLGPPFNAIPLALMAIQAGLMIKNMAKSKKEMKKVAGRFGGGGIGGGATAPQAPNFNVIGQTSAGENLIADTIQGANNRPIRAFVVDKDVTSSQELARNTENIASIG